MPTDLDYLAPVTVDDAVALRTGGAASAFLLGGTDLLPQMRAGRRSPRRLVDLKRIPELHEIRESRGRRALDRRCAFRSPTSRPTRPSSRASRSSPSA